MREFFVMLGWIVMLTFAGIAPVLVMHAFGMGM
jgi:hypothetical protein